MRPSLRRHRQLDRRDFQRIEHLLRKVLLATSSHLRTCRDSRAPWQHLQHGVLDLNFRLLWYTINFIASQILAIIMSVVLCTGQEAARPAGADQRDRLPAAAVAGAGVFRHLAAEHWRLAAKGSALDLCPGRWSLALSPTGLARLATGAGHITLRRDPDSNLPPPVSMLTPVA